MRILVVGAGLAGLTVAAELAKSHDVTLCERERSLRTEGYMIDFFGPGFDAAERLDLLPQLEAIHYPVKALVFVDAQSRTRGVIDYERTRQRVFHGRHFNFMRGDLERVLFERLPTSVRVRFAASPYHLENGEDHVVVGFASGLRDEFDLVIGADGVGSRIRRLVTTPADVRKVPLYCHTAAFVIDGRPAGIQADAFVSLTEADMTVACYPIRDDRTATFFLHRTNDAIHGRSLVDCGRELDAAYRGRGRLADQLLDEFPGDGQVYFDDVVQIELKRWSYGRVVLVGDACGAVSLLAGQGASMAVAGAYVLAQEINRSEDIASALARYEARVRPAIEARQKSGRRNAGWFLPTSHLRAVLRDRMSDWLMRSPFAGLIGRSIGAAPVPLDVPTERAS